MNLLDIHTWLTLGILTFLEIILCLDNMVFLVLVSNHLPQHQQKLARRLGLILAVLMRLVLLGGAFQLVQLTHPVLSIFQFNFSWRDMFMLVGGIFLIIKSIQELREMHRHQQNMHKLPKRITFFSALAQILLLDIVFSLDNIITAVAIAKEYTLMATAIIIAMFIMIFASEKVNYFINRYSRVKLLAIVFILFIGIMLTLQGFEIKIPHYLIYVILAALAVIILPNWRKQKLS